jgi:predicted esterase
LKIDYVEISAVLLSERPRDFRTEKIKEESIYTEQHKLKVTKNTRFFMLGEPGPEIRKVWFICHGYGQLGNYFLRNFQALQDNTALFIGCEGLNRFYTNGFSGRVGASWMTKEDRTDDIEDYIGYMDAVYANVMSMLDGPVHITAFGFSQGTATVCRWMQAGSQKIDNLVLWAGAFPPDVDLALNKDRFNKSRNFLVVGDEDEFIKEEDIDALCERLKSCGVNQELLRFKGKHEINTETLRKIFAT